jgi:lipopolysaccharide export LptBFGC system permease protein LptF
MHRRWVVGTDGDIYHYNYYDPRARALARVSIYEFSDDMRRFTRRSFAEVAAYKPEGGLVPNAWQLERGWTRDFSANGEPRSYTPFDRVERQIESAAYFSTEAPDPQFMSYSQLRAYIDRLQASGFDVLAQQVALARKVSFPFVTLVMTLIAVPFAVTMGRSGAMAGIGVAIGIAIAYWTAISVFAAMGTGGLIAPVLAAWAPNLLFAAGAAYLLLTVRT